MGSKHERLRLPPQEELAPNDRSKDVGFYDFLVGKAIGFCGLKNNREFRGGCYSACRANAL